MADFPKINRIEVDDSYSDVIFLVFYTDDGHSWFREICPEEDWREIKGHYLDLGRVDGDCEPNPESEV